jgi:MFS family permease
MDYWKKEFATHRNELGEPIITADQDSLIVSILSAGTFFGALLAAPFGDLLGRRWGLMISAGLVFNFGVILQTASTTQELFIAGRFFAGLGVGLISALSECHLERHLERAPERFHSPKEDCAVIIRLTVFSPYVSV